MFSVHDSGPAPLKLLGEQTLDNCTPLSSHGWHWWSEGPHSPKWHWSWRKYFWIVNEDLPLLLVVKFQSYKCFPSLSYCLSNGTCWLRIGEKYKQKRIYHYKIKSIHPDILWGSKLDRAGVYEFLHKGNHSPYSLSRKIKHASHC